MRRIKIIVLSAIGIPMAILSGVLDYGFQVILGMIEKLELEIKIQREKKE